MDSKIKCVSDEEKFEIFAYKSSWVSVPHLILGFVIVKQLFVYGNHMIKFEVSLHFWRIWSTECRGGVGKIEGGGVTARRLSHATTPTVDACLPYEMVN